MKGSFSRTMSMMFHIFTLALFLLAPDLFAVKTWDFRPEYFPYQLRIVHLYENANALFSDLDNDGFLECICSESERIGTTLANILVFDLMLNTRFQKNYPGKNLRLIRTIQILNVNSDPYNELLVPFIQNDSLFIDVLVKDGASLNSVFLAQRPHTTVHKSELWDCLLTFCAFVDLNGDSKKELISVMRSGFSLYPRGVFVHSYPEGELVGCSIIGAQPADIFLNDFDNDDKMEMIIHTTTPNNGASASGLTDRLPYILLYEFRPEPILLDSIVLGDESYTRTAIFYINFIGDEKKEYVTFRQSMDSHSPAEINIIDPADLARSTSRLFHYKMKSACPFAAPDEVYTKILAVDTTNTLLLIDHNYNVTSPTAWPETIDQVLQGPDINNDGLAETIIVGTLHSVLVNHKFDILTVWPKNEVYDRIINYPNEKQPLVMTMLGGTAFRVYKPEYSRKYLMYRYGYPTVGALFLFSILVILVFSVKEHHQHVTIDRYIKHLVESDSRAIAIIDRKLRVLNHNQQLIDWFALQRDKKKRNPVLSEWLHDYPKLAATLAEWRDGYTQIRRDKQISLETSLGARTLHLTFEPVPRSLFSKRIFQITFQDQSVQAELQKAKSWTHLAQRVAHDIKNPLGTILLILQKIRNLSEKKGADYAEAVAPHISKIEDRIESLRVMTRNFMKYINLETPHFSLLNLNEFLNDTLVTISKTVPPDIVLQSQIPDAITGVEIDREQMASVIENLISNAIDAMPKGGSITVSSRLAHRLQFTGYDDRPRDYALIEIRDTGLGIPPEVVERLFEPNFSYSKESSGLGLAMSKKIIEDHHGFIDVESEIETGTLFTIYVPAKSVL
ncbi:sensor histidine kinase [candidate division KSB1 bacterium]|nr:HAMP domain-containing histidine kinase [candidate division KSB1 bacterium]RQW01586.1 MAG: sensor histidine kinase [candidate division KSB1 bacterium]